MAQTVNPQYDGLSVVLAETFREVVDDNVFVSNTVAERQWEDAEKVAPGRFFSVPIAVGLNQTATSFGMYDEIPATPQQPYSAATYPWSFYVVSIMLSLQELALVKGINQRVDIVGGDLQLAIGSLGNLIGNDVCNFVPKGRATINAVPALGIVEATDDGSVVNLYGNILRTGPGSFANWVGNDVRKLTTGGIGAPTNDPSVAYFYSLYTQCVQGFQSPTEIYSSKQGLASYMYANQSQQRFASGDVSNPGFAGAALFGSVLFSDDHIPNVTNGTAQAANYYALNRNHTRFFYFGAKGCEFVDWVDSPSGALAKIARYVTSFQYASSQVRTGGGLFNVNVLANL